MEEKNGKDALLQKQFITLHEIVQEYL